MKKRLTWNNLALVKSVDIEEKLVTSYMDGPILENSNSLPTTHKKKRNYCAFCGYIFHNGIKIIFKSYYLINKKFSEILEKQRNLIEKEISLEINIENNLRFDFWNVLPTLCYLI